MPVFSFYLPVYKIKKLATYRPPKVAHIFLKYVIMNLQIETFFYVFQSILGISELWGKLPVGFQVFLTQPS